MKSFSTTTTIRATPEAVWRLLTDASGFPSWDTTYTKIDGRIALGEKITLHYRDMSPKVLPMKITTFEPDPPHSPTWRMVWTGGGLPEALFKGEQIFTLSPRDGGFVEFLRARRGVDLDGAGGYFQTATCVVRGLEVHPRQG